MSSRRRAPASGGISSIATAPRKCGPATASWSITAARPARLSLLRRARALCGRVREDPAMTERRLGVGLIGAHTWAEKAHLPGYTAHERVAIVAICDVMPERAQAM